MMDAAHHPGGRGLRARRASRPTPRRCCSSRSTACRPAVAAGRDLVERDRPRPRGPTVRVAADEAERAAAVEGPQVGVRRHRPHRAELLPARHGRAPHAAWSRCCTEVYAIAERHDLHRDERLPRRRRQPPPAARVRRAASRACSSGCTRRATRSSRRVVAAGGVLSGEHGIGLEKRDFMPLLFGPDDLDAQARLRDAFDPDGRGQPRRRCCPPGRAAATSSRSRRALWI